ARPHALTQQPGDAARDDARFAAAGAGEDEQRSLEVRHRLALRRRQIVQQVLFAFVRHARSSPSSGPQNASSPRLGLYRDGLSLLRSGGATESPENERTFMEIVGIGTDIVECLRVGRMIEEHGELFLLRVYTEREVRDCQSRQRATEHFAAR